MAETKPTLESEIDEIAKGLGRQAPAWKNEATTPPKTTAPPPKTPTINERIQKIRDDIAELDKALIQVRANLDGAVEDLRTAIGDQYPAHR